MTAKTCFIYCKELARPLVWVV